MGHEYKSLHRMLYQLNRPFANVKRWMNINAVCMILLLVGFVQLPRLAVLSPDGYAPLPLVFGVLTLAFFVIIVEAYIAIAVFSGIGWLMNVPGFFAIGVVRNVTGAEQKYRDIHIRFYQRMQGQIYLSGIVVLAILSYLFRLFMDWQLSGGTLYSDIGFFSIILISLLIGHILISSVARWKQNKWENTSDIEIHNKVESKRQRHPELAAVPSVDEMEQILAKASLGDLKAQSDAEMLNQVAGRENLQTFIWMIIIFMCFTLLFI